MAVKQDGNPEIVTMGDRTAIIAAGIAIGITLISAPGLYTLMNIPIGLVLIATLYAADSHKDDSRFQSASFALAWALAFLVTAGLFLVNPYITNDQGIFITEMGHKVKDQLTFIELPAFGLIKHSFGEEASDIVSFFIVGIVAIFWYVRRRRLYAIRQEPPKPQDEDKGTPSSKSSLQLALSPVVPEKSQEPIPQPRNASTSLTSEPGQRTVDRVILSVFTAVMALLVYVISTRGSKRT